MLRFSGDFRNIGGFSVFQSELCADHEVSYFEAESLHRRFCDNRVAITTRGIRTTPLPVHAPIESVEHELALH